MIKGIVTAVNVSEKKGVVKTPVPEVTLREDYGIIGDAHSGKGLRQVSLLGRESVNKMRERTGAQGLCDGKFAENITTEGICLYELPIGTVLKIGETVHRVSQIGKECHAGCEIQKLVGSCIMPKEGIFTVVLSGGKIKAGDEITVLENS